MAASSLTSRGDVVSRPRALIRQDDAGGLLYGLDRGSPPGHLTDFEASVETWGFVYGLAFALTRLDADPFEPNADLVDQLVLVGDLVRAVVAQEHRPRRLIRTVDELEKAWELAHLASDRSTDVIVTPALSEAINHIVSTGGRTRPGEED